jgi:hypothetical protein
VATSSRARRGLLGRALADRREQLAVRVEVAERVPQAVGEQAPDAGGQVVLADEDVLQERVGRGRVHPAVGADVLPDELAAVRVAQGRVGTVGERQEPVGHRGLDTPVAAHSLRPLTAPGLVRNVWTINISV